jgi:hypothetical protein
MPGTLIVWIGRGQYLQLSPDCIRILGKKGIPYFRLGIQPHAG